VTGPGKNEPGQQVPKKERPIRGKDRAPKVAMPWGEGDLPLGRTGDTEDWLVCKFKLVLHLLL